MGNNLSGYTAQMNPQVTEQANSNNPTIGGVEAFVGKIPENKPTQSIQSAIPQVQKIDPINPIQQANIEAKIAVPMGNGENLFSTRVGDGQTTFQDLQLEKLHGSIPSAGFRRSELPLEV